MKLFQYDKKVWDNGDADYTWQFGIFKNRSFLWVSYENPGRMLVFSDGGLHILLSFFTNSLFGVDFQVGKFGLAFAFFTEYFAGWEE
jgi:hypothetical protein